MRWNSSSSVFPPDASSTSPRFLYPALATSDVGLLIELLTDNTSTVQATSSIRRKSPSGPLSSGCMFGFEWPIVTPAVGGSCMRMTSVATRTQNERCSDRWFLNRRGSLMTVFTSLSSDGYMYSTSCNARPLIRSRTALRVAQLACQVQICKLAHNWAAFDQRPEQTSSCHDFRSYALTGRLGRPCTH